MSVRVVQLMITSLSTGRLLGLAVVCARARYATIHWAGAAGLDHVFVPLGQWLAIEREFARGLPAGPLPASSPIVEAILAHGASDVVVQYLADMPAIIDSPESVERALDAIARGESTDAGAAATQTQSP